MLSKFTRLLLCVFSLCLAACSSTVASPPEEVNQNFFEHPELMRHLADRNSFSLTWIADPVHLDRLKQEYTKVYVAPVRTDLLQPTEPPLNKEEVASMASYFREQLIEEIEESSDQRYMIVNDPTGEVFILEFALIKLVPTTVALNVLQNVGGFFIPGSIPVTAAINATSGAAARQISRGRIAMALRVRDGATGRNLGESYDERVDRAALLLNVEDFTRWGNARLVVRNWAEEFAKLLSTPQSVEVDGPYALSLVLW